MNNNVRSDIPSGVSGYDDQMQHMHFVTEYVRNYLILMAIYTLR